MTSSLSMPRASRSSRGSSQLGWGEVVGWWVQSVGWVGLVGYLGSGAVGWCGGGMMGLVAKCGHK